MNDGTLQARSGFCGVLFRIWDLCIRVLWVCLGFFAVANSVWPDFDLHWVEIEAWKKIVWFTVLPTAIFAGIGLLVLKRKRFVGFGILAFLGVEVMLFVTGMSAGMFL